MMTKDFEPITEVGIHQDDFGEGTAASNRPGKGARDNSWNVEIFIIWNE